MLNIRAVVILSCLLLLQACQFHKEAEEEKAASLTKLNNAASYNTQLGLAYLKQGDKPRAKRKLLLALSQAPHSPNANAAMAYLMESMGDEAEAERYYQKALQASPTSGAQLNNFGAFLCRKGKNKEAEHYFMRAVQDKEYINSASAYENAGLCALSSSENAKAERFFSKALEHDPNRIQSLYELITMQIKQEQIPQALEAITKYQNLVLTDRTLLSLAIDVANRAGKLDLEVEYKKRLDQLGNQTTPE